MRLVFTRIAPGPGHTSRYWVLVMDDDTWKRDHSTIGEVAQVRSRGRCCPGYWHAFLYVLPHQPGDTRGQWLSEDGWTRSFNTRKQAAEALHAAWKNGGTR